MRQLPENHLTPDCEGEKQAPARNKIGADFNDGEPGRGCLFKKPGGEKFDGDRIGGRGSGSENMQRVVTGRLSGFGGEFLAVREGLHARTAEQHDTRTGIALTPLILQGGGLGVPETQRAPVQQPAAGNRREQHRRGKPQHDAAGADLCAMAARLRIGNR